MQIELIQPADLRFASYNPRKVDAERLALVRLSLQKLGWLLPAYATADGEILSGHQRVFVARDLGYTMVPVIRLPAMPDNQRKALNILFNRSTNDFALDDTPAATVSRIDRGSIDRLAAALPNHPVSHFPCLNLPLTPLAPLLKANRGRWIRHAHNVAKSLRHHRVIMPIIAEESGCVVNGIGRLQMLAEAGEHSWYVLTLDPTRAEFARAMLNLLSMDFDLHAKYADLLRYNSFRRSHHRRPYLGRGMTYWVIGRRPSRQFNIANAMDRAKWVKVHGTSVVDFGAGHFTETELLRAAGIHVAAFEPYRLTGSEIDRPKSIESARLFLTDVASGRRYDSVFVSSVLNSVPFYEDRRAIVKIVSALCDGRAYFVALHTQCVAYRTFQAQYLNDADAGKSRLKLDYELGIAMGDISELPKIQKYHTPEEFYALIKTAFSQVQVTIDGGNVCAVAAQPFDITHGLKEALTFEFDLPYPDGQRMGLADEAIAAFSQRLGVSL